MHAGDAFFGILLTTISRRVVFSFFLNLSPTPRVRMRLIADSSYSYMPGDAYFFPPPVISPLIFLVEIRPKSYIM